MGDRVVIQVKGAPCAAYVHWGGAEAIESLKLAIPSMRQGDEQYSAARLIASLCSEHSDTNRGVGVLDAVSDPPISSESHGDAGIIVYDCSAGETMFYYGYLREEHGESMSLPAPPA